MAKKDKPNGLTPEEIELILRTGLTFEQNYAQFRKTIDKANEAIRKELAVFASLDTTREDKIESYLKFRRIIRKHLQFLLIPDNCSDWRLSHLILQEFREWIMNQKRQLEFIKATYKRYF